MLNFINFQLICKLNQKYTNDCAKILLFNINHFHIHIILILKGEPFMNQIKIGKFIAECRKKHNLTQKQLAEKLHITDRAVSKWENGKSMPDSSIMLSLCKELGITVNDLLLGEVIEMKDYNKEMENRLIEMVKQKEEADKKLLTMEIIASVISIVYMLAMDIMASYLPIDEWLRVVLVVAGLIPLLFVFPFLIKIEQTAGYYECKECKHRYVPTLKSVLWSMHMGRTRYMKCPECGKKSWQKKVLTKEKE